MVPMFMTVVGVGSLVVMNTLKVIADWSLGACCPDEKEFYELIWTSLYIAQIVVVVAWHQVTAQGWGAVDQDREEETMTPVTEV